MAVHAHTCPFRHSRLPRLSRRNTSASVVRPVSQWHYTRLLRRFLRSSVRHLQVQRFCERSMCSPQHGGQQLKIRARGPCSIKQVKACVRKSSIFDIFFSKYSMIFYHTMQIVISLSPTQIVRTLQSNWNSMINLMVKFIS